MADDRKLFAEQYAKFMDKDTVKGLCDSMTLRYPTASAIEVSSHAINFMHFEIVRYLLASVELIKGDDGEGREPWQI